MKKICKSFFTFILCITVFLTLLSLIACNNGSPKEIDKYDIRQFFGDYESEVAYFEVRFLPQEEVETNLVLDAPDFFWRIISANEESFNYLDADGEVLEQKCDAFLLKSMRKLMGQLSGSLTVGEGFLCLKDSEFSLKYELNSIQSHPDGNLVTVFNNVTDIGTGSYKTEAEVEFKVFTVINYDDYVIDENGIEWEIIVCKTYKEVP